MYAGVKEDECEKKRCRHKSFTTSQKPHASPPRRFSVCRVPASLRNQSTHTEAPPASHRVTDNTDAVGRSIGHLLRNCSSAAITGVRSVHVQDSRTASVTFSMCVRRRRRRRYSPDTSIDHRTYASCRCRTARPTYMYIVKKPMRTLLGGVPSSHLARNTHPSYDLAHTPRVLTCSTHTVRAPTPSKDITNVG